MSIDRRTTSLGGFSQVDPTLAKVQAQVLGQVSDDLTKTNEFLQGKALQLAKEEFNVTASQRVREIYTKDAANPALVQSNIKEYRKNYMKKVPSAISSEVNGLFTSLNDKYITKAKDNQVAIVNNQAEFLTARKENEVEANTIELTSGLFGEGLAQSSSFKNALDGINTVHEMYATLGEDGKPLYTPEQRIAAEEDFAFNVLKSSAVTALRNSPNKLATIRKIRNNEFIIPAIEGVTTEETKLDIFLPVDRLTELGKSLTTELNNEFKLSDNEKKMKEKEDTLKSFEFENGFFQAMETGTKKTSAELDEAKPYLTTDQFVEMKVLTDTIAPDASNEQTINRLRLKANNGEDIEEELLNGYFQREVSDEDYVNLRNREQSINNKPITPVENSKQVFGQMKGSFVNPMTGAFNKIEDSVSIAKATTTFNDIHRELQLNGQVINNQEGYDIALYSIASNLPPREAAKFGIKIGEPKTETTKNADGTVRVKKVYPKVNVSQAIFDTRKVDLVKKYSKKLNTTNKDIILTNEQFKIESDQLLNFYGMFDKWD